MFKASIGVLFNLSNTFISSSITVSFSSSNTNSFMDELLCCIYNNAYGDSFSSKFKTGSCVSTETDIIETTFKEID